MGRVRCLTSSLPLRWISSEELSVRLTGQSSPNSPREQVIEHVFREQQTIFSADPARRAESVMACMQKQPEGESLPSPRS